MRKRKRKRKNFDPMEHNDKIFFQSFYEEYKNYMYYIARKYVTVVEDCEDLVQDTVIRLMHNIPTLRLLSHFKIAKYISLTVKSAYLDSEKIKKKDDLIFLDDTEMESIIIEQFHIMGSDQVVTAKEAAQKLKKELPARDWLLLDAKYNLGFSQDEIGRLIGVAPDSVRMLLYRAREKAKQILDPEEVKGGERNG